jgi:hypothetical protein
VAELVYAYGSEPYLERVEGSNPSSPTLRLAPLAQCKLSGDGNSFCYMLMI